MLRYLPGGEPRDGSINLSRLLRRYPEALPPWVLFSFELKDRLSARDKEASPVPPPLVAAQAGAPAWAATEQRSVATVFCSA